MNAKRCAIYTRKSSEEGLDQAFNSLHAQREACEAYVKSQAGEGWRAQKAAYDDGGISGGTMERPGLKRLLDDVAAGRIDIVVVYKVDRLTRSLADFAKMVELFDAKGVSFVSVTQAFNTTTSMGRLTLNVLLSFAQFEREVTGERIRDKLAASKAKGMWMGGLPPLGYAPDPTPGARSLVIVPDEAELVRRIFQRYLELGSVNLLSRELDSEGVRSKVWVTQKGRTLGGQPFSRGALFYMLRNPIFVGRIAHKGVVHPGLHAPIIDGALFEAVQARLASGAAERKARPIRSATAPLKGLIFDALERPMTPTFTRASGRERINRYYVSAPVQQGRATTMPEVVVTRVPAGAVEAFVLEKLRRIVGRLYPDAGWAELTRCVRRVEVAAETLTIELLSPEKHSDCARLSAEAELPPGDSLQALSDAPGALRLRSKVRLKRRGGRTSTTLLGEVASHVRTRPDPTLVSGLRRAHALKRKLSLEHRPGRDAIAPGNRYEQRLLALAFMSPNIQAQLLSGRQPAGLSLQDLIISPTPLAWADQHAHLETLAARRP